MKKLFPYLGILTMAIFLSFKTLSPSVWTIDKAHSKIGFTITHMLVTDVDGFFTNFEAKINAPNEDFTDASVSLSTDLASVNTLNDQRDTHLKSPDFFDAVKFPNLTFNSTSFKKTGEGKYHVQGNLTMHGVTKLIDLDATARTGTNLMTKKALVGFNITGVIKRTDFGIGTNYPGAAVSDEVTIKVNAEFVKQ